MAIHPIIAHSRENKGNNKKKNEKKKKVATQKK